MKNIKPLLFICMTMALTSCGINIEPITSSKGESSQSMTSEENSTTSNENTSSSSSSSSSSKSSSSTSQEETIDYYELFFNPSTRIEMTMDFTADALQRLSDCGQDSGNTRYHDVYHPCTMSVKINNETFVVEEVGARMKGNTSRQPISFGYVNFKVSFNQTFDDETYPYYTPTTDTTRKDRLFLNEFKKLDLKWNKNRDNTFTKELYAQHILEEEGLMAQKANMCTLTVKQDGVALPGYENVPYHVYETVDKPFLKRRLNKNAAKGDLYKSAWPATLNEFTSYGVEDNYNDQHYIYNLKTNEDDSDHSALQNCITKINQTGAVTDQIKNDLMSVVDVQYLLKYAAMMWVIGNPDDLRYNKNNTYFYFNSNNGLLYLIPYDNDRCFGILQDWPIDLSNSEPLDKRNCNGYDGSNQVESHLLWRTFIPLSNNSYPVVEEWKNQYVSYCEEYATKYLNVAKFQQYTNSFALAPSKVISSAGGSNQSFEEYASNKLGTLS
ncbi:MAG: CotH kinase family protein [Bacilli bacterium]|nr:CotH kinase family protein [Bacilli bacterium]